MSGWSELGSLGVTVRPFDGPPPRCSYLSSPFRAPVGRTVERLASEIRMLRGKRIVLELNLRERDIRLDGLPRADASPSSPAVRVSFESKWGPVVFETAEFGHWEDNLRAVALSMQALRSVDRYGVSKRGEQYRGWRQIPMSTGNVEHILTSRDQAEEFLGKWDGDLKRALAETHPDKGGDPNEFRLVVRARDLLRA